MNDFENELFWLVRRPEFSANVDTKRQVDALRSLVQQGKYRVSAHAVAERFLAEHLFFQRRCPDLQPEHRL